jgi:hypothetical protein
MIAARKGQAAVIGLFLILVFILIAAAAADLYYLFEVRNWAYSAAQSAALIGVSRGRDWGSVTATGQMALDPVVAYNAAAAVVALELASRNYAPGDYAYDVRVLPDPGGGFVSGYPPRQVRLEGGGLDWSSPEPAVGVYVELPVEMLLLDIFVADVKNIYVFAAAGVNQP